MSSQVTDQGITSVGGLLPIGFLSRLRDPKSGLEGIRPSDYHLGANERITEIVSRSWNRLTNAWAGFSDALAKLDEADKASALTRDKWLGLVFVELGYGRLQTARSIEIQGEVFPISHTWGSIPIHLVGARVDLDRRTPGVRGAAGKSPHSLVQELLNSPTEHLWGIVSNGLVLRILRDSTSLTRQSYLEFNLEEIFSNDRFDDFVTFWMIAHQSRFEGEDPSSCWLERWRDEISESGIRALDALQGGVRRAIEALGEGLVTHPENQRLRAALESGALSPLDLYRQILRLIYRILFLLVAEDRNLLHGPQADLLAVERYEKWYSTKRLRQQAWGAHSDRNADLWQMLKVVMRGLGDHGGLETLGLSPLGSYLWGDQALPDLLNATISNRYLGRAIVHLSTTEAEGVRRNVDFANLGAEELGSVYEALLELTPVINGEGGPFVLRDAPGNERKTSGSFYTPSELVAKLLETALDPVIEEALAARDPETELLSLKILDPACGSGHFLIAAAHRIAERLAAHRVGEPEAPPAQVRHALREVIAKCCYGVDINPMAVELAKVSLWMEAMEAGKPLTFLERHIVTGNALIGTTPALVARGIPDGAYKVLDGDDNATVTATKKRNKSFVEHGQSTLNIDATLHDRVAFADQVASLDAIEDDNINDVVAKGELWEDLRHQRSFEIEKWTADAWCTAFFYNKVPHGGEITTETIKQIQLGGPQAIGERERTLIEQAAKEHQFLHFHVAFPEVFRVDNTQLLAGRMGWTGGFDVVLGNPPFLSQLKSNTRLSMGERNLVSSRLPGVVKSNTDLSALFLSSSLTSLRPGGWIAMVQPQSLLTARDAGGTRFEAANCAELRALWIAGVHMFSASVFVCAPTLRLGHSNSYAMKRYVGPNFAEQPELAMTANDLRNAPTWAALMSTSTRAGGNVQNRTLRELAEATADFRDQYYGLIPYVHESADAPVDSPRLLTTGLVDPALSLWGVFPTRFGKVPWKAPIVDRESAMADLVIGDWVASRLIPKVIVASQTNVIEALADPQGIYLPSVPLVTVFPNDPADLWMVLSVLLAPASSRWAYDTYRGAALSVEAIKLSASQLLDLPLPNDLEKWRAGAQIVQSIQAAGLAEERPSLLTEFGSVMSAAYLTSNDVLNWWLERLPRRR